MNEIGKRITDKLIEIYGSASFSIAFLPYKRSMWNSMASVYEECQAAGAKAYCVPIPYYKVADGKIEGIASDKECYEFGCSVSFFEQNTFDFVVIHYPYDGNNKVTRMCSAFHTAELRKYGKVVYIPYSCTNLRQLRVQPGIANVDYAFLGSEAEAEAFINEWQEFGVDFSGRVFGLGSPKMDAIQKCNHSDDGIKTAVVINSLAPFLWAPFAKIEIYEQEICRAMLKDYRVIFRPHPLLRQTIKSMRPDTETAFNEFVRWCGVHGVEVDESEYLEETLSKADYLISDASSVLEMWASTGREYKII